MEKTNSYVARFPSKLYERLRKAAKVHHRSIREQIVAYIEQAIKEDDMLKKER